MLQGILPAFSGLAELPPPVQQLLKSHTFILREPQLMDNLQQKRRSKVAAEVVTDYDSIARVWMKGKAGVQRVNGLPNLQLQGHQKQYESRESETVPCRW